MMTPNEAGYTEEEVEKVHDYVMQLQQIFDGENVDIAILSLLNTVTNITKTVSLEDFEIIGWVVTEMKEFSQDLLDSVHTEGNA